MQALQGNVVSLGYVAMQEVQVMRRLYLKASSAAALGHAATGAHAEMYVMQQLRHKQVKVLKRYGARCRSSKVGGQGPPHIVCSVASNLCTLYTWLLSSSYGDVTGTATQ